jgi:hypothetical protein
MPAKLDDVLDKGPRTRWNMGQVTELRQRAELPTDISVTNVNAVVEHVGGDFDLALAALTQSPRPQWVAEMLGLHPDRPVGA